MSSPDAERAERIEQLFHEAAHIPTADLNAFLDRTCGADRELRDKLGLLLRARCQAPTALERGALELEARHSALAMHPARPDEFFGSYRILRFIAAGGMGRVYEAVRDDAEFHKRVAIKFVQQGIDDPAAVERFRSERQILAQLEHPNISRLLDGGTTADGIPYLVMEYVDGERIDQFVTGHSLARNERLKLFLEVCDAVQHAHRNLVVHRDLKPSNILVTSDAVPKLLDFGIAKLLTQGSDTATGRALTPEYASPEQLQGSHITTASDIYSLGVLLFVLLADRLPYRASADQPVELVRAICEHDPVWEPRGLIRGDLRNILAKALHKEPRRRYVSVEQFASDIRRYSEGLPVVARPDSFFYRARRFAVRRSLPLAAVAAIVTVALVGGLSTLAQSRHSERRFHELRSLARSVLFELYDSISSLPGSVPARRLVVSRAQQYLDSLAREAGNDTELAKELAESYLRLGDVRGKPYRPNLGDTAGALESYRKAQTILEPITDRYPNDAALQLRLIEIYGDIGLILARQNNTEAAIDIFQRAMRAAEALHARSPQNLVYTEQFARAHQHLGEAQYLAASHSRSAAGLQQALATYQKALAIQEAAGPQVDDTWQRSLSLRYFFIGYALRELGNLSGDVSYYQKALDISMKGNEIYKSLALKHAGRSDAWISRAVADGLNDIGLLRWKCCQDLANALMDLREALRRFEVLAAADPSNIEGRRDVADATRRIGTVLAEAGRKAEAMDVNARALTMYEELARADPSSGENAAYLAEVRARIAALKNH